MSEMIERVARAIYETWAANRSVPETWDEVSRLGHSIAQEARDEARAAMGAMQRPTAEMVSAALECDGPPSITWMAMIDEALK